MEKRRKKEKCGRGEKEEEKKGEKAKGQKGKHIDENASESVCMVALISWSEQKSQKGPGQNFSLGKFVLKPLVRGTDGYCRRRGLSVTFLGSQTGVFFPPVWEPLEAV